MGVPWSTFEKWLTPEGYKSFREMPQMAWRMIRRVVENQSLSQRLSRLTHPNGGIFAASEQSEKASDMEHDEFATSKRDSLVSEYLLARGIFSIEEAPDDLIDAANAEADKILGASNNN